MAVPLVALDTETTGVHPEREIWEIGMIKRHPDGQTFTSSFFIEDVDLSRADPFGLSIGRFYERHPQYNGLRENGGRWREGPLVGKDEGNPFGGSADYRICSARQAAVRVEEWTRGAHIIGAVPNFDTESLGRLLRQYGLIPAWHYHLIDVENLMVGYLMGAAPGTVGERLREVATPPWKSDELAALLGVEPSSPEERHTALGDAEWALRCFDAVMGL
jgi:hypothetical protein